MPESAAAHAGGFLHPQHLVSAGFVAITGAAGLRDHEGRHRELHPRTRDDARSEGHPGELSRSWADLDAANPDDDDTEKVESFGEQTPLGRAGQPAEVATAFVFLASAESSYITGEVIAVTGWSTSHGVSANAGLAWTT